MSIYPPNTTVPKKGSDGYLWNWLGSPLKKFAAALSPYITGESSYKVYSAAITQTGTNNIEAQVFENTIDSDAYWERLTNFSTIRQELKFPNLPVFSGKKAFITGFGNAAGNNFIKIPIFQVLGTDVFYYCINPLYDDVSDPNNWTSNGFSLQVVDAIPPGNYVDLSTALNSISSDINPTIYIEIRLYP